MQTQETSIKSAESMTRTRIRREQITNEERRDSIFRKRMRSLAKKANELSVLCEINVAIVVHSRTENNEVLWPSPKKFMEVRNDEIERRIVTHEKLLEHMVQAEREEIKKLKKAMEIKESQQLMVKSLQSSFDGLTLDKLKGMSSFTDDMLQKLAIKEMKLNNG